LKDIEDIMEKTIKYIVTILYVMMFMVLYSCKFFTEPEPYVNNSTKTISDTLVTLIDHNTGKPFYDGQKINTFNTHVSIDLVPDSVNTQIVVNGVTIDDIVLIKDKYGSYYADTTNKVFGVRLNNNNAIILSSSVGVHSFSFRYSIVDPMNGLENFISYSSSKITLDLEYDDGW
jgi:hypothetical protein